MPEYPPTVAAGRPADVCLVVEGAYPYVRGGVSSWVQDLIQSQCHLRFHVLVICAPGAELTLRYPLPDNVSGLSHVFVQEVQLGATRLPGQKELLAALRGPAARLMAAGDADDLRRLLALIGPVRGRIGRHLLLDSPEAWDAFNEVYHDMCAGASYLNAFWAWRSLLAGLYSMVLCPLPEASVYHSISTGYAGLLAARAHLETGRPTIVTEHGVYTNERRLEILAAPWLAIDDTASLSLHAQGNRVKDLWINTFVSYSQACYQCCQEIITLFEGNFALQLEDGAARERLSIIPNGIAPDRFADVVRVPNLAEGGERPPSVALVGRVVPIKDIKTFIRACALLKQQVPDVRCYVLGPMDEDPPYAAECQRLLRQLNLQDTLFFPGMVDLREWFGKIDVLALTSISEAQPLVILEAGVAGVPSVATDVGSCRELLHGRSDESPKIGAGGAVTPIGNPAATANAIAKLLLDEPARAEAGENMRQRVMQGYDKEQLHRRYAALYHSLIQGEGTRATTTPALDQAERAS